MKYKSPINFISLSSTNILSPYSAFNIFIAVSFDIGFMLSLSILFKLVSLFSWNLLQPNIDEVIININKSHLQLSFDPVKYL